MTREKIIETINQMPEDANVDDIIERILFMKSVEDSIQHFEEGNYIPQSEIENMVKEWRKSYGQ